jgi:Asp-tRNA(Asn)/Glu-tRNA(Gln) amidotransferase A subunit family amidase
MSEQKGTPMRETSTPSHDASIAAGDAATVTDDAPIALAGLDRRAFMGYFSTTSLAGTLFPGVLWARLQQGQEEPAITAAMIAEAEKIAGLELTPEEREEMRRGLDRNAAAYADLRALQIPNEVVPALLFEPVMPGVEVDYDDVEMPVRVSRQHPPAVSDDLEALAFMPLTQLAELVRTRQVGSEELTRMYLARLQRYDPKLLFVVNLTEDLALKQARRADQEIARGSYRGPLHGIPWGAKDLLATRDYPTTWGAEPYREQIIHQDATVVRKLDEAGAVLVAKLTLGALAQGDRWFGGQTRNPWNTAQGSSGSSAGPGSATAAGCVGFAIGTETRGSITSPSTRNGVTGMRPTFGRVSRAGAMALSWSMDKIGPMCRSAEDCALVFAAIHGADGMDPCARTLPFGWNPYRDPRTLRVGFLESAFEDGRGYDNRDFDLATLRALREQVGVELIPIELPDFPVGAMNFILSAEAGAAFEELTLSGRDDLMENSSWPNTFRTARFIPAVDYINANRARAMYMRHFSEVMRDIDVFVTPTSRGGVVGATNLTGHPQVVVPNGFSAENTPYSISFVGGLYKDADALLLAHAYQQVSDFHLRHPDVDAQPMPEPSGR